MEGLINEKKLLNGLVDYQEGSVVSRIIIQNDAGSITLFAFDSGQGLSEHTAPFDAYVQVTEGTADITSGGKTSLVSAGEAMIMPGGIPHSLKATRKFKMLLVMIKNKS
ncbi:MAG: cupin domain-containing protein [Spirochaetes bacterium]|jgi:quercetin dioxygenase-like cupin family protein|nr:cupin domain-containing protein [Spirochaetota bacterium]